MGIVLRAISDDYTASWSVGISVERGVALSWAMSAVVATLAGLNLAGLALLVAAQSISTHGFIDPEDLATLDPVNKGFAWAFAAWIAGCAAAQILGRPRSPDSGRLPAFIGYTAILMWVSVAAAGRWIAFA